MNILLDMIMLFVFLTIVLLIRIPDLTSNNYLLQQFYIYFIITIYYVVQKIVEAKFIKQEEFEIKQIIKDSLKNAVPCLFGYVLFTDLRIMDGTKDFINHLITHTSVDSPVAQTGGSDDISRFKLAYVVSFTIVFFTIISKMLTLMFDVETYI
jgi:hypothetical protein